MAEHMEETQPGNSGSGSGPEPDVETPPDWRANLPDDLKRFAANLATPADAVRMAAGLRQKLSNAVVPPGSDASDDDVAAFRRRMGVPDKPEGYVISRPGDLPRGVDDTGAARAQEEEFLEVMHSAGATPEIVQAAFDWYYGSVAEAGRDAADRAAAGRDQASRVLLREWGDDYERNMDHARRAARAYGGDGLVERLDAAGLGNDPAVIRAFHLIGLELGEDEIFADAAPADRRLRLEERARDLRRRADRWTNAAVDGELRDIMEQLHGTRPVDPGRK